MVGFIIGVICGAGELYLLLLLTRSLQAEQYSRIAGLVSLKFILLALAFTATILINRAQILWSGIGMSLVLVLGSLILSRRMMRQEEGDDH